MIKAYIIDENNWTSTILPVVPRVGEDIFAFFDGKDADPSYKRIVKIAYCLKEDESFDEISIDVKSYES